MATLNIESFISSATLEVRFMPSIDSSSATKLAVKMRQEMQRLGSHATQVQIIAREDHLSIVLEFVELDMMTPEAYKDALARLKQIAADYAAT
jgi:hypothetical protein